MLPSQVNSSLHIFLLFLKASPNNLQIVGKKIDEAISTKHLNKSINPTQFDYTFQITEPAEKHVASGGFRVPQGNFGKNTPISSKSNPKINVQEKNLLTKNDIMKNIGIYSDMNNEENEFLEASEPFTDFQYMETIKNRRDMADLVIENIEKNIGKLHLQREHLKEVKFNNFISCSIS